MARRLYSRVALALILSCLSAGLFGCSEKTEIATPPRPVYTIKVPEASDIITRTFSGSLDAAQSASLSFEIAGRIIELPALKGESYKQGDVLAKIDCTQYEAQLLEAEAQAKKANQDIRRIQVLFENGNASKQDLDNAIATKSSADARLQTATKQVKDCTITMPYDGVVSSVPVDLQQTISPGMTVAEIKGKDGMEMDIGVPENLIGRLSVGLEALVRLDVLGDKTFKSTVSSISQDLSDGRTYQVTLELSDSDPSLKPGMSGEAEFRFRAGTTDTILIPFSSVVGAAGDQRYVWIFSPGENDTGVVERRDVDVGAVVLQNQIEVFSGIKPGEIVVTRGANLLEEGTLVRLLRS